ncbi:helix-turn-helix domain-containing protein [Kitasatospora sp. NPDC097643]|uniref:ArsR/SmtB family transcription factor n=1 Tax=Kitasatospora sp. NPDC097643 TaxID=3157230 RepID=UPI00331B6B41
MTDERRWPHSKDPQTDVVLNAKGLRALAHPVRMQLLGLLRKEGPSTATRLAERLGLNSGATSYHLRQLAAAGFVEEDEERGNARERWWRSVHKLTVWTGEDMAAEEPAAVTDYLRSVLAAHTLTAQRVVNAFETMPREWRKSVDLSDLVLRLTPEEAQELSEEMTALIGRYRRVDLGGPIPEGAEQVSVVYHVLPEPQTVTEDAE